MGLASLGATGISEESAARRQSQAVTQIIVSQENYVRYNQGLEGSSHWSKEGRTSISFRNSARRARTPSEAGE